ncbi:MarR family transcriptional regulator [Kribbella sp. NPDC056861]|uniref:MarR family winged helix-turn-helix transcriptional regulator n=1 Tax=Kribbella sp. NPDC056861 TaxID=3154857 RepID=UPI0034157C05
MTSYGSFLAWRGSGSDLNIQVADGVLRKRYLLSQDHPGRTRGVPMLDDRENRAWRNVAMMLHLVETMLEQQVQRDAGVSHAHYKILVLLSESPDRTVQLKELAQVLQFSISRVSHAVTRLESLGLVVRSPVPQVGKAFQATLTKAGLDLLRRVSPIQAEVIQRLVFGPLTDAQVDKLDRIAVAIVKELSQS